MTVLTKVAGLGWQPKDRNGSQRPLRSSRRRIVAWLKRTTVHPLGPPVTDRGRWAAPGCPVPLLLLKRSTVERSEALSIAEAAFDLN
jgi:hypothetical protein